MGKTDEPTTQLSETALGEAVRQVVRAASHDDGRPLLTGVLVSRVDGSIRMVATDSYRMAMRDLPDSETIPGEEDLLVPARALSELQRLPTGTISDGSETNRVGVAANSNEITFWQGNVQISTRLLEGRYPDYKQLIPDHYPNKLHLGKESFLVRACGGCSCWCGTTRRRCGCPCARAAWTSACRARMSGMPRRRSTGTTPARIS